MTLGTVVKPSRREDGCSCRWRGRGSAQVTLGTVMKPSRREDGCSCRWRGEGVSPGDVRYRDEALTQRGRLQL